MNPLYYLRNVQNIFGFALRSRIRVSRNLTLDEILDSRTKSLQDELLEFLQLFDWKFVTAKMSRRLTANDAANIFTVADVGARDFSFAPVFEKHFLNLGFPSVEVHGIEIDSYRRYSDFTARGDRGRTFAASLQRGFFHSCDFLDWSRPVDSVFFLHPFVTPEPPLRWGLPLSVFKPQELFKHAFDGLADRDGFLVLSNPTEREFDISYQMARRVGFREVEAKTWMPRTDSVHQRPRFGMIFETH